jgi:hypothetical protein
MRCNMFGTNELQAVDSKSPYIAITVALNSSSLNAVQCAAALVHH